MTIPITPAEFDSAELDVVSRCVAHWRGEDLSFDLVSGQVGTFSRAATASVVDTNGTTFTAAQQMAAWEPRDWLGGGTRTHMGLLMGATDRLSWDAAWRPRALSFYHEFMQVGGIALNNVALWSICNDAATGARLVLDSNGTFYRLRHHNGTAEVTVTLAVAPTSGQKVVMRGILYADGSVQLWQAINFAAESATGRSAAPSGGLATAWASGARTRLGSLGTTNGAPAWHKRFKIAPNLPDAALLARLF